MTKHGRFILCLLCALMASGLRAQQETADFDAVLSEGNKLFKARKYDEARPVLLRAYDLAATPAQRFQVRMSVAETYLWTYKNQLAQEEFLKAAVIADIAPADQALGRYYVGYTWLRMNKYANAREEAEKALAVPDIPDPTRALALTLSGRSSYHLGEYAGARKTLAKVMELTGASRYRVGDALFYTACSYFDERNFDEARAVFDRLLALRGSEPTQKILARSYVIRILTARNDIAAACAFCDETLALPKVRPVFRARIQILKGDCHVAGKDYARARAAYEAALATSGVHRTDKIKATRKLAELPDVK